MMQNSLILKMCMPSATRFTHCLTENQMTKTFKKFIWKDSRTNQTKVILARSEYQARKQNFGNLAGYLYSHSVPLN